MRKCILERQTGPQSIWLRTSGSITFIQGHYVHSRTFKVESRATNRKQGPSSRQRVSRDHIHSNWRPVTVAVIMSSFVFSSNRQVKSHLGSWAVSLDPDCCLLTGYFPSFNETAAGIQRQLVEHGEHAYWIDRLMVIIIATSASITPIHIPIYGDSIPLRTFQRRENSDESETVSYQRKDLKQHQVKPTTLALRATDWWNTMIRWCWPPLSHMISSPMWVKLNGTYQSKRQPKPHQQLFF